MRARRAVTTTLRGRDQPEHDRLILFSVKLPSLFEQEDTEGTEYVVLCGLCALL